MARAAGRQLSDAELAPLLDSCAGNPLLLEQAGAGLRAGPPAGPTRPGPPRQLVDRFAGLPAPVLAVAKAASVAGVRFQPSLVAAVAETEASAAAAALGVLVRAGLARPAADGQVEFAHPLLRRPSTKRSVSRSARGMHALAMHALLAADADPHKPRRTPSRATWSATPKRWSAWRLRGGRRPERGLRAAP